jgi:two-component sensor histidine kinase
VVTLDRAPDGGLVLVVTDDGQGYVVGAPAPRAKAALGSSIIEGLVAQLKGTIMVESRPGKTRSEIRLARPVSA